MLDAGLKTQLATYLKNLKLQVTLIASMDESKVAAEMGDLLAQVAAQSPLVTLETNGMAARRPSFAITRAGTDIAVEFAGLPMGHEFTSLVLALLWVGGHPPKIEAEQIEQIKAIEGEFRFETYFSQHCQNCPDVVQALNLMSVVNPRIRHVAIDGAVFQAEVESRKVMSVPTVLLNGAEFGTGRMTMEEILGKLDAGAAARDVAKLATKEPFEVLVVGGGPAGAAAAIYTARKGIRTGVVAERFGGQVLDTMGIENFVSVQRTEGPKLAADMERHVREYGVEIMNLQHVTQIAPPETQGGLVRLTLKNGATLQSRSVILAPGARWRQMNAKGEDEYRNKGVAYCPHCDGPLYKGKRVAVIGGGNSGVEAAIDLAGIVAHVTLIEFDAHLRADAVLQRKLASLPNATVITSARTTEVLGDGIKVVGLSYLDRKHDTHHEIALEGIFVQIGLMPNTEWLKEIVTLSPRGEIQIDSHNQTSMPGVFAAGDATTVPYKQIIIATGEGSKAALSAFDYLIRLAPEQKSIAA